MLEGKAIVKETDMPESMQIKAMASASEALDTFDVLDCRSLAAHIKKAVKITLLHYVGWQEFDRAYGGGWQCVVGSSFGCFFTHKQGTFIYFALGSLNFLLFKATPPT
ncbi:unnamed protein product [Linum tenue]|uniref:Dynein light chain n=1 Tax=Linum tenue TaxID=586396 RepID=A0AAV0QG22_9ROSI|nr:unnamed protein product [Linum tenue]